jgi:hypothetical protein
MTMDRIDEIGIDPGGRLYVKPVSASFPDVYREAMEVHWDPTGGFLHVLLEGSAEYRVGGRLAPALRAGVEPEAAQRQAGTADSGASCCGFRRRIAAERSVMMSPTGNTSMKVMAELKRGLS